MDGVAAHGQRSYYGKTLAGGRVLLGARAVEDEPAAATVCAREGRRLLAHSTAASSAQGELARQRRGQQRRHRLRPLRQGLWWPRALLWKQKGRGDKEAGGHAAVPAPEPWSAALLYV
jgi:hypothetical protein